MLKLLIVFAIASVVSGNLVRIPIHRNDKYVGSPEQVSSAKEYMWSKRNANKLSERVVEQAESAFNNRHYGVVTMGTPPQSVTVLFDTTSSELWFYNNATCPQSIHGQEECPGIKGFGAANSTTFKLVSNDYITYIYDSGEVDGYFAYDTLSIGDLDIGGQFFTLIFTLYDNMPRWSQSEGLFGLRFTAAMRNPNATAPLRHMVDEGLLQENVVSLYFPNESQDGEIIFGGSDPSLYKGNLSYANISEPGLWQFQIPSIYYQGLNLCTKCEVQIDSSTNIMAVPMIAWDDINFLMNATITGDNATVDCDTWSTLPDIEIVTADQILHLPPSAYIEKFTNTTTNITTCSSLIASNGNENMWILSDTFLSLYYTSYDYAQSKIGFAPLIATQSPIPQPAKSKKICKSSRNS